MNDQSDQQCKLLGVHTALCGFRSTDSDNKDLLSQNWGNVKGMLGVQKYKPAIQTRIRHKRVNFRIPYFRPSKCHPMYNAARGACPIYPLRAATERAITSSSAMAEGPRELDQRFQVGGQFEAKL